MINDDQRDGDRQRADDSQPNKRKRITTSHKSYDNNRYNSPSDSREKKPLFSVLPKLQLIHIRQNSHKSHNGKSIVNKDRHGNRITLGI